MVSEKRTWNLYRGRGLLEVAGPIGRVQQVVGGSEWVSVSGRGWVIFYWVVVSFSFEYV